MMVCLLLLIFGSSYSQEFLLYDHTFTWHADDDPCGGFHYWQNFGEAPTMNWTSPFDYQSGRFYFRFEIINQPSDAPFQLNFCIWTELADDYSFWRESCATLSDVLHGPGSISTFSGRVSPAYNEGIDWTDLSKLWRFGNPMWVNGHNMGNGSYCTDHPEEWENYQLYFPLTLRVTIVAVADGYNFSGWSHYPGTPTEPVPNYVVDFATETTDKVVPPTDEYAYQSDMTGAISGTGNKLTLTPGRDMYFRTPSDGSSFASEVQHLMVPLRPDSPVFGIDFAHVTTMEQAGAPVAYSESASRTDKVLCTGNKISLEPGHDVFFWKEATTNSFASANFHLQVPDVPAAPVYHIDFEEEVTAEVLATGIEYSAYPDWSSALPGEGLPLSLLPDTVYYFRVAATDTSFAGEVLALATPHRPFIVPLVENDTVHSDFQVQVDFPMAVTGFAADDLETVNAELTLVNDLKLNVHPMEDGEVRLRVRANTVNGGNFSSDWYSVQYKSEASDIPHRRLEDGQIFPVPMTDVLYVNFPEGWSAPLWVQIFNASGTLVMEHKALQEGVPLPVHQLPKGMYCITIRNETGMLITATIVK